MDDRGLDDRKLARDRLTWEHIAFAFAVSGPYSGMPASHASALNPKSVLTVMRSLLTSRVLLAAPVDAAPLLSCIDNCTDRLLQELSKDPASNASQKNLGSDETTNSGANIKINSQLATNVFFGIGDTLGTFLSSFTTLHVRQGSRELYAEAAHTESHKLLAGHSKHLDFQRWLTQSNDATRSISSHAPPMQFGVLHFFKQSTGWSFWHEWYQSLLKGEPLDLGLQRRITFMDDSIWDAGPEAVAAEIKRIRSHFELEQEVARLKEQLAAVERTPTAALIGDNGGPPLEDAAARALQTDLALIWKQVEELESEIAKPSPSPPLLDKIAKALWDISLRMAAYCGSVADDMIREGSKELAKAGAKWTARATAVTVTAQTESVQSVAKAIWAFVKALQ